LLAKIALPNRPAPPRLLPPAIAPRPVEKVIARILFACIRTTNINIWVARQEGAESNGSGAKNVARINSARHAPTILPPPRTIRANSEKAEGGVQLLMNHWTSAKVRIGPSVVPRNGGQFSSTPLPREPISLRPLRPFRSTRVSLNWNSIAMWMPKSMKTHFERMGCGNGKFARPSPDW
jgi:hypothetical protein